MTDDSSEVGVKFEGKSENGVVVEIAGSVQGAAELTVTRVQPLLPRVFGMPAAAGLLISFVGRQVCAPGNLGVFGNSKFVTCAFTCRRGIISFGGVS